MRCVHSKGNTRVQGVKDVRGSSKERGIRGETTPQTNNQSSPMSRREQSMEEQNRLKEEKDRNTQKQET